MNRYPIILASMLCGCAMVSLENAQHSARVAAAAAAGCPAAHSAAAEAQNSANHAQQASQDYQTHQDQARALQEEAARARSDAELYRRRARDAEIEYGRLQRQRDQSSEFAAETASSCRQMAEAYREDEGDILPDLTIETEIFHGVEGYPCDCDSTSSCRAAAERYEDEADFLETAERTIPEAQAAVDENLAAAERAEQRARQLEQDAELASAEAARAEARVKEEEERAAAAAAAAQELAFEQCGATSDLAAAPPADGTYSQDIFGAQQRGLPGSVSASCTMQASCAAIQIQCIASCTAGGASCSPGAPAGCLSCFASGCF